MGQPDTVTYQVGTWDRSMANSNIDVFLEAPEGSAPILMRRVTGNDGSNITQSDISSGVYSIFLLDDQDADSRTAVTGHAAVSLGVVSGWIWDTLQTGDLWNSRDSTGYNFRHQIDISSNAAFTLAGRRYLVEYTLTPSSGQVIVFRFVVDVI